MHRVQSHPQLPFCVVQRFVHTSDGIQLSLYLTWADIIGGTQSGQGRQGGERRGISEKMFKDLMGVRRG